MRLLLHSLASGILLLVFVRPGTAQSQVANVPGPDLMQPIPKQQSGGSAADSPEASKSLELCLAEIANLRAMEAEIRTRPQDEDLKKKIDLLEKHIDTLEKLVKLLAEQMKKAPGGPAMEQLQAQAATLEGRSVQAARRDVELAEAVDDLREHADAQERYGPQLPAQLKELFLPSGNNETPLSIYGALSVGYSKILGNPTTAANGAGRNPTPGGFYFGEFTPDFLLKLNDWIFLEAEIAVNGDGSVSAGAFAQADFFIND